jgi:hypothetical protein
MVEFTFMTYDDEDGMCLGSVKWPVLPRKGETVILDGLIPKDHEMSKDPPNEEVMFIVDDIVYRDDMANDEAEVNIEVWLTLPPGEAVWDGAIRS